MLIDFNMQPAHRGAGMLTRPAVSSSRSRPPSQGQGQQCYRRFE